MSDCVKSFSSVLHCALEWERHFALIEEAVPTKARSVIVAVRILDPPHASLFDPILDHVYYFKLS